MRESRLFAVLSLAVFLVVSPLAKAATGTIDHDGQPLTLASAPTTLANTGTTIADGTKVTIICQSEGQTISGDFGPTSVWDLISVNGSSLYAPDAFVNTGTNNLVAPICGTANGHKAYGVINNGGQSLLLELFPTYAGSTSPTEQIQDKTVVQIICQSEGQSQTGSFGASHVWDLVPFNGDQFYGPDAFVLTGTNSLIAPICGVANGHTAFGVTLSTVNERSGPHLNSPLVGSAGANSVFPVFCQKVGDSVNGDNLWDDILPTNQSPIFIADNDLLTGTSGQIAPTCP